MEAALAANLRVIVILPPCVEHTSFAPFSVFTQSKRLEAVRMDLCRLGARCPESNRPYLQSLSVLTNCSDIATGLNLICLGKHLHARPGAEWRESLICTHALGAAIAKVVLKPEMDAKALFD